MAPDSQLMARLRLQISPIVQLPVDFFLLGTAATFAQLLRLATDCGGVCGDMRSAAPLWLTELLPSPDRFDGGGVPAAVV